MEQIAPVRPAVATRYLPFGEGGLTVGQIVRARVAKIDGDVVQLRWGQQTLSVASKVPLTVGQQVNLMVEEGSAGKVLLRMVDETFGRPRPTRQEGAPGNGRPGNGPATAAGGRPVPVVGLPGRGQHDADASAGHDPSTGGEPDWDGLQRPGGGARTAASGRPVSGAPADSPFGAQGGPGRLGTPATPFSAPGNGPRSAPAGPTPGITTAADGTVLPGATRPAGSPGAAPGTSGWPGSAPGARPGSGRPVPGGVPDAPASGAALATLLFEPLDGEAARLAGTSRRPLSDLNVTRAATQRGEAGAVTHATGAGAAGSAVPSRSASSTTAGPVSAAPPGSVRPERVAPEGVAPEGVAPGGVGTRSVGASPPPSNSPTSGASSPTSGASSPTSDASSPTSGAAASAPGLAATPASSAAPAATRGDGAVVLVARAAMPTYGRLAQSIGGADAFRQLLATLGQEVSQTLARAPLAPPDLGRLIVDVGVHPDEMNAALVSELLAQGAGVTEANVRALRREIAAAGGGPTDATPAVLLHRLGLPVTALSLAIARQALAGQLDPSAAWNEVLTQLQQLARGGTDGDGAGPLARDLLAGWRVPIEEGATGVGQWLRGVVDQTALPLEAKLARPLAFAAADEPATAGLGQDVRARLDVLAQTLPAASRGDRHQLSQAIQRLQATLQAEQTLNGATAEPAEPRYFAVTLPAVTSHHASTIELRVRERDARPGALLEAGADVVHLKLSLPGLGDLGVNVTVGQTSVSCHFAAASSFSEALITASAGELIGRLKRLGYQHTAVDAAHEPVEVVPPLTAPAAVPRIHHVDLKA